MLERYVKNIGCLSEDDTSHLAEKSVCVVGCGGLGGYVIEMLGRIGIGSITAVDGDVFDETNLNRQILSSTATLGSNKAAAAKDRMAHVNPAILVNAVCRKLDQNNAHEIIANHHVIVDALDNKCSRIILQNTAEQSGIPLVHGAIAGWNGQVTTIMPGDRTFDFIFSGTPDKGIEKNAGTPSFSPALVASIQVSEVIKLLLGRGTLLHRQILFINLLENSFDKISL